MVIDTLAKPVIDALMRAFDRAGEARLRRNARQALAEAIRELIRLHPDVNKAEARIAIAKAAGILDQDLFVAKRMLKKVKKAAGTSPGPAGPGKPAARKVRRRGRPDARGKAKAKQQGRP